MLKTPNKAAIPENFRSRAHYHAADARASALLIRNTLTGRVVYWLSTRPSITACMPDDTLEKKSKPVIAST